MLVRTAWGRFLAWRLRSVHPPSALDTSDMQDPAALLAWAARLRACSDAARAEALTLRAGLDDRGITGPAGEALAQSGRRVAGGLTGVAEHAADAAAALVRAAHEADAQLAARPERRPAR